jgi:hypothetical protein
MSKRQRSTCVTPKSNWNWSGTIPAASPDDLTAGFRPPQLCTYYIANPEFLTAVRVCDSGVENFKMLIDGGFTLGLLVPKGE